MRAYSSVLSMCKLYALTGAVCVNGLSVLWHVGRCVTVRIGSEAQYAALPVWASLCAGTHGRIRRTCRTNPTMFRRHCCVAVPIPLFLDIHL